MLFTILIRRRVHDPRATSSFKMNPFIVTKILIDAQNSTTGQSDDHLHAICGPVFRATGLDSTPIVQHNSNVNFPCTVLRLRQRFVPF